MTLTKTIYTIFSIKNLSLNRLQVEEYIISLRNKSIFDVLKIYYAFG